MIKIEDYKFALQDRKDFQSCVLHQFLFAHNIHVRVIENPLEVPKDYIPFGSCEWTEKVLGRNIVPDYYPQFLQKYLFRKVWYSGCLPTYVRSIGSRECFVKPADRYKRFDGQIFEYNKRFEKEYAYIQEGPYICSEVVSFVNEWRYYVADGQVVASEWYKGINDIPCKPPKLTINWPANWIGVVDFGLTDKRKISLVEAQCPYSFGWYPKDYQKFAEFIILGWQYMKKLVDAR